MCVVLPFSRMDSLAPLVGRTDWVTREAGRVGLMGRERGGRSIEWRCTYITYTAWSEVSVSLGV